MSERMTREEAEKYIKSKMCNNCGIYLGGGKCSDNCTVIEAIKALEIEPCEDAISRQATVERLCKVAEYMNERREGLGSPYVMAALFIQYNKDEFPSVTPKPETVTEFADRCRECGSWREIAQVINKFIDNLERIEEKYAEPQEESDESYNNNN